MQIVLEVRVHKSTRVCASGDPHLRDLHRYRVVPTVPQGRAHHQEKVLILLRFRSAQCTLGASGSSLLTHFCKADHSEPVPSMFSIISWCEFVSQENDLQYNHLTDRLSICKVSEQIWPHLWVPHAGWRELPEVGCGPRSPLSPLQPAAASGTTLLAGAPQMLARPSRCPVQNCSAIFTANQVLFRCVIF